MRYREAHEIRRQYPRRLTKKHIDAILEKWRSSNLEFSYMLFRSAKYDFEDSRVSRGDLELYLRALLDYYIGFAREIINTPSPPDRAIRLFWFTVTDITNFNDHPKYASHKQIRKQILTEYLDAVQSLNERFLRETFSSRKDLFYQVKEQYQQKGRDTQWRKEVEDIFFSYVNQKESNT